MPETRRTSEKAKSPKSSSKEKTILRSTEEQFDYDEEAGIRAAEAAVAEIEARAALQAKRKK